MKLTATDNKKVRPPAAHLLVFSYPSDVSDEEWRLLLPHELPGGMSDHQIKEPPHSFFRVITKSEKLVLRPERADTGQNDFTDACQFPQHLVQPITLPPPRFAVLIGGIATFSIKQGRWLPQTGNQLPKHFGEMVLQRL